MKRSRKSPSLPALKGRLHCAGACIEPLEDRIAPATLVSPTEVTYQDTHGDQVTVTISKPLFTAASVAKVFTFSTGAFGDSNASQQQLELLNITKLGPKASGMDITITSVNAPESTGLNIGYINASDIDLGNVTIGGDLGRIAAGDQNFSTQGLHSLTVDSLGAQSVASTQLPGGNLNTLLSGGVGSITVNGDIDGASIGIGGGAKGVLGSTQPMAPTGLLVTGSIYGGAGDYSGSVRTQGGITSVEVDGSIIGGAGTGSGSIGTAGALGPVLVKGGVTGGGGASSGAILSTGSMHTVEIDGSLSGGAGSNSGQIGTASNLLGPVTIGGSVTGGGGYRSGSILATGNIASITIAGDLAGGAGAASGQIGSASTIHTVLIEEAMTGGALVHAFQSIQSLTVTGGITGGFAVADQGAIGSISAGDITDSGFDAGGSIGAINSTGSISGSLFVAGIDLKPGFSVADAGAFDPSSAASFGFGGGAAPVAAHIGAITVSESISQSTFLAGVHGPGADGKFGTKDDSVATGSSVGAITAPVGIYTVFVESGSIGATISGAITGTTYIATDSAVTAGGIGAITVTALYEQPIVIQARGIHPLDEGPTEAGIGNSTFISNAGVGDINVTLNGLRGDGENAGIASSTFQAGHAFGTITVVDNESGSNGENDGIYNTTFNGGLSGHGGVGDISVTLTDSGPDGNSAAINDVQIDATVCSCMKGNMGSIYAENADTATTASGILDSTFRTYGNIGPISATMDSGSATAAAIEGSTFSAFGSIGDINVYGAVLPDGSTPSRFLAGYDIGSDMTFGNEDLSAKSLALQGGQSVGNVTVTGYFEGSDIIASIKPATGVAAGTNNPASDYIFGDSAPDSQVINDANVGKGGSIGQVSLGTNVSDDNSPFNYDHAVQHGIEAENFLSDDSPIVGGFGYYSGIPTVLYVDGAGGDVRITNLTQVSE